MHVSHTCKAASVHQATATRWQRHLRRSGRCGRITGHALDLQARLRVGARLQHLQSERSTLVAKLQALSDPQDVEMYEQVGASHDPAWSIYTPSTRRRAQQSLLEHVHVLLYGAITHRSADTPYMQAAIAATELRANMRLEAQANHMFQVRRARVPGWPSVTTASPQSPLCRCYTCCTSWHQR